MLTSSCAASASTCEKSGLSAALSVVPGASPQRAVSPGSPLLWRSKSPPGGRAPPGGVGDDGRVDFEVAPGSDPREAGEPGLVAQVAVAAAGLRVEPQAAPQVARPDAQGVDAPGLRRGALREAQRREGDRHLDLVAVGGHPAGRVPQGVPRLVLVAGDVVVRQVHLHAQRVDEELEGAALVVEGVEHDAGEVVVEGVVAVAQPGADLVRLGVVGADRHVEAVAVVGDPHLGRHRRGDVVPRGGLVVEGEGGWPLPGRVVENAVHGHRADGGGDLVGAGGRLGRRRRGGGLLFGPRRPGRRWPTRRSPARPHPIRTLVAPWTSSASFRHTGARPLPSTRAGAKSCHTSDAVVSGSGPECSGRPVQLSTVGTPTPQVSGSTVKRAEASRLLEYTGWKRPPVAARAARQRHPPAVDSGGGRSCRG